MLTLLTYLLALAGMGTIGVLVPFLRPLAVELHASPGAVGLGIALFSAPSALFATLAGEIMQRVGLHRSLVAAAGAIAIGDLIIRSATGIGVFDLGLLVAGFGLAGAAIGCPVLLTALLEGKIRTRAIALWSTYAPTGFAFGLLIAIPFASAGCWRAAVLLHAILVAVVAIASLALIPPVHVRSVLGSRASPREFIAIFRHLPALRLAAAVAIPNGIAYGTSLVAPSYLARVHGVSLATSTGAVAAAKIAALVIGAVTTGQALSNQRPPRRIFAGMVALGAIAQIVFFLPSVNLYFAVAALILWLFAFGGMSGTAWALMPRATPSSEKGGATSGMMNQMISVISFAAPSTYFALTTASAYVALGLGGLVCALFLLPSLRIER